MPSIMRESEGRGREGKEAPAEVSPERDLMASRKSKK